MRGSQMRESSTRHQARRQKRGERVQVRMMAGEGLKEKTADGGEKALKGGGVRHANVGARLAR